MVPSGTRGKNDAEPRVMKVKTMPASTVTRRVVIRKSYLTCR